MNELGIYSVIFQNISPLFSFKPGLDVLGQFQKFRVRHGRQFSSLLGV